MSDYDYLDKGNSDGTILGKETSRKVAFWGTAPVDQAAALTAAMSGIVMSVSASAADYVLATAGVTATTGFGFANTAESSTFLLAVQNVQTRVAEIETALKEIGLIAGGTAATSTTEYDYVGWGGDDGMILGQTSSAKIAILGMLPVDQPAALDAAVSTITCVSTAQVTAIAIFVSTSVSSWGFGNMQEFLSVMQAVMNAQTRVATIQLRLAEIGIIAGGTALTAATDYDYLDKGNDDGTIMGKSTAKIGFYGTAPVVQPSALTTAYSTIVATAASASYRMTIPTSDGSYKAVSANQLYSLIATIANAQTRIKEIEVALEGVGLVAAN